MLMGLLGACRDMRHVLGMRVAMEQKRQFGANYCLYRPPRAQTNSSAGCAPHEKMATFPAKTSAGIRPPAAPPLSGLGAPWLAALRSGRALCTRHPTPLAGLGHRSGWVSCCTPVTPDP